MYKRNICLFIGLKLINNFIMNHLCDSHNIHLKSIQLLLANSKSQIVRFLRKR